MVVQAPPSVVTDDLGGLGDGMDDGGCVLVEADDGAEVVPIGAERPIGHVPLPDRLAR